MSIKLKNVVSRRMAMVETNDDRNGIVVHRSISQRSGANQKPMANNTESALTVRDFDNRSECREWSLRGVEAIEAMERKRRLHSSRSLEQSQEWDCGDQDRRRKSAIL